MKLRSNQTTQTKLLELYPEPVMLHETKQTHMFMCVKDVEASFNELTSLQPDRLREYAISIWIGSVPKLDKWIKNSAPQHCLYLRLQVLKMYLFKIWYVWKSKILHEVLQLSLHLSDFKFAESHTTSVSMGFWLASKFVKNGAPMMLSVLRRPHRFKLTFCTVKYSKASKTERFRV